MNSQMTLLAFAGKWDGRGARGLTTGEAREGPPDADGCPSMLDRASNPRPLPARLRNCRRERKWGWGGAKMRCSSMDYLSFFAASCPTHHFTSSSLIGPGGGPS